MLLGRGGHCLGLAWSVMGLEKIICYGAGSAFHWIEEALEARLGTQVLCVIDRDATHLQAAFRCPVIAPTDQVRLHALSQQYPDVPVVITLGDPRAAEEVMAQLKQAGFRQVVTLNAVFEAHLGFQLEDHTLDALDCLQRSHGADIAQIRQQLADQESVTVFDAVLEIYRSHQGQWIPSHPVHELPFPPGLSARMHYDCVVKCGLAIDELEQLLNQEVFAINTLIGFEPDYMKFAAQAVLSTREISLNVTRSALNQATALHLMPFAVSSENAQKRFYSSLTPTATRTTPHVRFKPQHGGFGSRLHAQGPLEIKTVTLDAALEQMAPTLIFADAEGEELNILHGAVSCIRRHRPALVIALYHQLSHMWQVPDFILRQLEGYDLYIRNYTGFIYETFLYALPKAEQPGAV